MAGQGLGVDRDDAIGPAAGDVALKLLHAPENAAQARHIVEAHD